MFSKNLCQKKIFHLKEHRWINCKWWGRPYFFREYKKWYGNITVKIPKNILLLVWYLAFSVFSLQKCRWSEDQNFELWQILGAPSIFDQNHTILKTRCTDNLLVYEILFSYSLILNLRRKNRNKCLRNHRMLLLLLFQCDCCSLVRLDSRLPHVRFWAVEVDPVHRNLSVFSHLNTHISLLCGSVFFGAFFFWSHSKFVFKGFECRTSLAQFPTICLTHKFFYTFVF